MPVGAQDDNTSAEVVSEIPADEFGRGTPRRTADGFLAAVDEADYEAAAEYPDLRGDATNLT